jgi:hypothetical protein
MAFSYPNRNLPARDDVQRSSRRSPLGVSGNSGVSSGVPDEVLDEPPPEALDEPPPEALEEDVSPDVLDEPPPAPSGGVSSFDDPQAAVKHTRNAA